MAGFEYKVVPAPGKGIKAKGLKTAEARFSFALETLMNEMGAEGWEYQRADTLPSTERSGLTGHQTVWRHVLVFRRPRAAEGPQDVPPEAEPLKLEHRRDPEPTAAKAEPVDTTGPQQTPTQTKAEAQTGQDVRVQAEDPHPAGQPGATTMLRDNGVEEVSEVSGPSSSLSALAEARARARALQRPDPES